MNLLSALVILLGLFFLGVSGVGAIRLPDFYTRSHVIGVTDTIGTLFVLSGLALHFGISLLTAKIVFIFLFIHIANPTITHVLVRAAYRAKLKPWSGKHD